MRGVVDNNLGSTVFNRTKDDKLTLSIEDKFFPKIMDEEFFKDHSNSWVAPLPFCTPRHQLPNNKEQALSRLISLHRTLEEARDEETFCSIHAEDL